MATATTPRAGVSTWTIDSNHSTIDFSARHLMISTVRGRFKEVTGTATVDESDRSKTAVLVTIPVASIDTGVEPRDAHLRSADFFDAEHHPTMTFRSKKIVGDVEASFKLIGDLTIRGTTKEITLDVTNEGRGQDPWGNERVGFHATGKVNRHEYGLNWNQALETGGVVVGPEIKMSIDVEFTRPL